MATETEPLTAEEALALQRAGERAPLPPEPPAPPPPEAGAAPPVVPPMPDLKPREDLARRQQETLEEATRLTRGKEEALVPFREAALEATQAPLPAPPAPPVLPTPPPTAARPLFTVDAGPDAPPVRPETNLQNFMAALQTFATAMGGAVTGNATGSLAAITGATEGWIKGDRERVDRDFKAWEAQTKTLLHQYTMQRNTYTDILTNQKLSLDQKMNAMQIAALPWEDALTANAAQQKSLDAIVKEMDRRQEAYDKLQLQYQQMAQQKENADRQHEIRQMMLTAQEEYRQGQLALQREGLEVRREALADRQAARGEAKRLSGETAGRIANVEQARESAREVLTLAADKDVKGWLGQVGAKNVMVRRALGMRLPQKYVDLEQAVSNLNNRMLNVLSGAAVSPQESERIMKEMPKLTSHPDVFLREAQNANRRIIQLEARMKQLTQAPDANAPKVLGVEQLD